MSNPSQPFPPTADQSSLLNFPRWSIPLTKLITLHTLLSRPTRRREGDSVDQPVSLIVCVLSVDQPVQRQRRDQKVRGEEGTLWIGNWAVTAPPSTQGEEAGSCQVKLWDNQAREWSDERVKKGDIVLLESEPPSPSHYTTSSFMADTIQTSNSPDNPPPTHLS